MSVTAEPLDAAVIVCAYTLERWDVLNAAIEGLRRQSRAPREIVLVIDNNEELLTRARAAFPDLQVVANAQIGNSGARNTGCEVTSAATLVFLDDDALPDDDWLEQLLLPLEDALVLGTGGSLTPIWDGRRPDWLTDEFLWTVGCTYTGLPTSRGPIRNLIAANMSVRRSVFELSGGFDQALGRRDDGGTVTGTAEETEFCIRAQDRHRGSHWLYVPEAHVRHHVPARRTTWQYFRARCELEGAGKAALVDRTGTRAGLESERSYVRSVLPRAMVREAFAAAKGDRHGARALGGIAAGLGFTGGAYVRSRWAARRSPKRAVQARSPEGMVSPPPLRRSDVILTRALRPLPARLFATLRHRRLQGTWTTFRHPTTHTEHIVAKMLFDRDPRYKVTADKYAVRDYVAERVGEGCLIPLLQVADDLDAIRADELPDAFVIKPTHGANAVVIVAERASVDWGAVREQMRGWLATDWYAYNKEWAYRDIPRRLIVETFLEQDGRPPPDFKLSVFRGRVRLVQVDVDRFGDHRRDFFDEHWNRLNVACLCPPSDEAPAKPAEFDEMVVLAERLGGEFEFARVDLYSHRGRVRFGEITHYPDGGGTVWAPPEFDLALGHVWSTGGCVPARFRVAQD